MMFLETFSHNQAKQWKVVIMGAAGRDFHNFNVVYRDDPNVKVVAFTATQIPGIAGRKYPPELSGKLYPEGIPIHDESGLEKLIEEEKVDECVLSYSDISYDTAMHLGSRVMAAGAKFSMLGSTQTMLKSAKPVIAVVAVRTGSGKSQTTRQVTKILREGNKKPIVVRHPMPYGDLAKQKVQRYEMIADLKRNNCTIEEMEEYEPHLVMGNIVYAGVDYAEILEQAEPEADVIVWDGGNNDMSFYKPDLTITVADALRAGHEITYYPGEVNFRLADVILVNKINSAAPKDVETVMSNARKYNPSARIITAESQLYVGKPQIIKGKRVLVIEDGPTLTHGEMKTGAGTEAAKEYGASLLVDPRPYATGSIKTVFEKYPHTGPILPAMGYGQTQIQELEETINNTDCDLVLIATPIDLSRLIKINKPALRVEYELCGDARKELQKIIQEKGFL